MPLFEGLLTRLGNVSLSDINHELGKAKESLQAGGLASFRSPANQVGLVGRNLEIQNIGLERQIEAILWLNKSYLINKLHFHNKYSY